jgi:hypothetical protein
MQATFPPALRIAQSVETLATDGTSSLVGLNTNELSPDCLVLVQSNNTIYVLHKSDNTTAVDSPNVIVPAVGPGRWFAYGSGASFFQNLAISHAQIPPQSSVDASVVVDGVGQLDVIAYSVQDTGVPVGVAMSFTHISGPNAATFRFVNASAVTVAAATVSVRAAVLKSF